jgi:hypothetical protein
VDDSPSLKPQIDWAATADVKSYATASAHEPNFADRKLWPNLVGPEAFTTQNWPKGRLLVWAHPGQSGSVKGGTPSAKLDSTDPANWLEDGKPATNLWDENTDLLLPDCDTHYSVALRDFSPQVYRHLTVGRNATLSGGGDGKGRRIMGNVWIKRGGSTANQGSTTIQGDAHTFWRNDNVGTPKLKLSWAPGKPGSGSPNVTQYFTFAKSGGSIEFLGHNSTSDEFNANATTVIVGPDSILQPGRAARPKLDKKSQLILLDGAYWGKWMNDFNTPCLTVAGGSTVQGGMEGRPLKRDALLGIGHKNYTAATYEGPCQPDKNAGNPLARSVGLLLEGGSSLKTVAAKESKARLTITSMGAASGATYFRWPAGSDTDQKVLAKEPQMAVRNAWFDALPLGIDLWIGDDCSVDGVAFDHLRKGGLACQSETAKAAVHDPTFGPHCYAKGQELFSIIPKLNKSGGY